MRKSVEDGNLFLLLTTYISLTCCATRLALGVLAKVAEWEEAIVEGIK